MFTDEYLFTVGKANFLGKTVCQEKQQKGLTLEVKSLPLRKNNNWGWPVRPQLELGDHLDGMPEGFYRIDGKRRSQPLGWYRQYLCELLLDADIKSVWCFPNDFCEEPFFELFYCAWGYPHWIGPQTSQKLLQDVRDWSPMIDELQDLEEIFAVGADHGFVCLEPA